MCKYNHDGCADTWVPNDDAASAFFPVATKHDGQAGMGTNSAFIGSSDGAHTGWQVRNPCAPCHHLVPWGPLSPACGCVVGSCADGSASCSQNARAPKADKSLAKLKVALDQQLHYVSTGAGDAQVRSVGGGGLDVLYDGSGKARVRSSRLA